MTTHRERLLGQARVGFEICAETFYGHIPKGVIDPSTADFSVPRTCTLPAGHRGNHLSDPDVLRMSRDDAP